MIDWIYPRRCPVCHYVVRPDYRLAGDRGTLPVGIGLEKRICPHCYEKLTFIQGKYCVRCGQPLEREEQERCRHCETVHPYFTANRGMLDYANPYADRMVWDLKYNNKKENAEFLALEMARRYGRLVNHWGCEALVPVPVHPAKERQRGYNQAAVLAHRLGSLLDLPVEERALRRTRRTIPQKGLNPAGRFHNLEGAFRATTHAQNYRTLLLVDDIYTTGATLQACAKALQERGVTDIYGLTCCIGHGEA